MLVKGQAGWAEWSPFLEYPLPEAARWLASAIEWATTPLVPAAESYPTAAPHPTTRGQLPESVPVNATVPACDPVQVPHILARFSGASTVKVKVAEAGHTVEHDMARIRAVRAAAPDAWIRLDANGAYPLKQAQTLIHRLIDDPEILTHLDYIEQPVATVEALARLREWVRNHGFGVHIAADESIRKAEDPYRVAALGAADVIVIKVQPLGGVAAALRVVHQVGLPAVVSSALETSVGLAAGAHLAALLPARPAGLGTGGLLTADVTHHRLLSTHGYVPVTTVEPEQDCLEAVAAAPSRRDWWLGRLEQCWEYLYRGATS